MPDIYHDVPISGSVSDVFDGVSTSEGLSKWWSRGGRGEFAVGKEIDLDFGPEYQWKAIVEEFEPNKTCVLCLTDCGPDWEGTKVRFFVERQESGSLLRFEHVGWTADNAHYRTSSYCWAMYLRCLKMYVEHGTEIEYSRRFEGFRN